MVESSDSSLRKNDRLKGYFRQEIEISFMKKLLIMSHLSMSTDVFNCTDRFFLLLVCTLYYTINIQYTYHTAGSALSTSDKFKKTGDVDSTSSLSIFYFARSSTK